VQRPWGRHFAGAARKSVWLGRPVAQEGRVIYDIREVSKGGIDWVLLATVRTLGFALGWGVVKLMLGCGVGCTEYLQWLWLRGQGRRPLSKQTQ
jgi:hypothetical protein